MRVLIAVALVILLLAVVGWITFSRGPERSSINIETEQIEQDTQRALDSGARVLEETGDSLHDDAPAETETTETPETPTSPPEPERVPPAEQPQSAAPDVEGEAVETTNVR